MIDYFFENFNYNQCSKFEGNNFNIIFMSIEGAVRQFMSTL